MSNLIIGPRGELPSSPFIHGGTLRQFGSDDWQKAVWYLMSISGIIVVDAREVSSGVADEIRRILSKSYQWKTAFVTEDGSRESADKVVQEILADAPRANLLFLDEAKVVDLTAHLVESRELPTTDRTISQLVPKERHEKADLARSLLGAFRAQEEDS